MSTAETPPSPDLPPYPPERFIGQPYSERARLALQNWAYESPHMPSVMALYWVKYFFVLIAIWAFWCSFNAGYTSFFAFSDWAFTTEAFKKAGSSLVSAAAGDR